VPVFEVGIVGGPVAGSFLSVIFGPLGGIEFHAVELIRPEEFVFGTRCAAIAAVGGGRGFWCADFY
jgi:hypothetical protein